MGYSPCGCKKSDMAEQLSPTQDHLRDNGNLTGDTLRAVRELKPLEWESRVFWEG